MKTYMLFGSNLRFEGMGWDHFINDFYTIESAEKFAKESDLLLYQIIKTATKEDVTPEHV